MSDCEIELNYIVTRIPERWRKYFGLKISCNRFVVCYYYHRFLGPPKYMLNFLNEKNMTKNFLAYIDIFNCAELKVLELYATGAKAFLVDV